MEGEGPEEAHRGKTELLVLLRGPPNKRGGGGKGRTCESLGRSGSLQYGSSSNPHPGRVCGDRARLGGGMQPRPTFKAGDMQNMEVEKNERTLRGSRDQ